MASSFLKEKFGNSGLNVLAVIFGITDVDAITLSTGRLVKTGQILEAEGHSVILIAIVSNVFFKGLVVGIVGGKKLSKIIALPWVITLIVGFALVIASF